MKKINPSTYKVQKGENGEVILGNENKETFKPCARLKKWNGECKLDVSLPDVVEDVTKKITSESTVMEAKSKHSNRRSRFYELDTRQIEEIDDDGNIHTFTQLENGGFEFEVILDSKPEYNVIEFDIDTQELNFFYQPELTQKEKDNGSFRPENVIGSYAVYHSSKRDNKYKTGKAFHIYRPKIIDDVGNEIWGKLNVDEDNGKLTVTIPQSFLDSAVYPVSVDPTFGFDSIGDTHGTYYSGAIQGNVHNLDTKGIIIEINVYYKFYENNCDDTFPARSAIYDSSLNLLHESIEIEIGETEGWKSFPFASFELTTGDYALVENRNLFQCGIVSYTRYYATYDTVSIDTISLEDDYPVTGGYDFPDSVSFSDEDKRYSIYATYELALPPTIDGEEIDEITIDGDEVEEVTMDGDVVWSL